MLKDKARNEEQAVKLLLAAAQRQRYGPIQKVAKTNVSRLVVV